jgi:hypothetical protein
MMPNKQEIIARAREMFFENEIKHGVSNPTNPEECELIESGYYSSALSEIMTNVETKNAKWENFNDRVENFEKAENISTELFFNVSTAMDSGFYVSGTSQSGKTNLAKHLVQQLINNGITCYVLDTSQAWTHDTPVPNVIPINSEDESYSFTGNTVFDISSLNTREKVAFVNMLCRTIYQEHVNGYRTKEFLVFEDAQCYLPSGCMRLAVRRSSPCESVLDVVTVGANYGLRFGLITQFPALVDKPPVKITQQRYFGWTWEKNDLLYVRAFIGKEWAAKLIELKRGQFIYQNKEKTSLIQVPKFEEKTVMTETQFNFEWQLQGLSLDRKV